MFEYLSSYKVLCIEFEDDLSDVRLRCLSIVVGTVTVITLILALEGWGPAALQDHWASQPKVHYDTSAPFMALYGLFNFQMYILAYLFSPGGGSIHGTYTFIYFHYSFTY